MLKGYKIKWNYYNEKLTCHDRYIGAKIYKEFVVNNNQYIILKYKLIDKQIIYICKKWNGQKWCSFATKKNPREALNRVKEEAYWNKEDYSLYA